MTYLPLYLKDILRLPSSLIGLTLALAVVTELPLMPVAGKLGDRIGGERVLLLGFSVYAAYFVMLSLAGSLTMVILAQPFLGFGISCLETVGLLLILQCLPGAAGSATGISQIAFRGGPMLGGLFFGWILQRASWPAPFVGAALTEVIAALLMGTIIWARRHQAPPLVPKV